MMNDGLKLLSVVHFYQLGLAGVIRKNERANGGRREEVYLNLLYTSYTPLWSFGRDTTATTTIR